MLERKVMTVRELNHQKSYTTIPYCLVSLWELDFMLVVKLNHIDVLARLNSYNIERC